MTSFLTAMKNELSVLNDLLNNLLADPEKPERSSITARRMGKKVYYYQLHSKNGIKTRDYIGEASSPKLKKLVKASFKDILIKTVKNDLKALNTLKESYIPYDKPHIMNRLSPCVRELPFELSFTTVMNSLYEWAHQDYERNPTPFRDSVILAIDGTRVRSKSECLIYNALLVLGIPFRYAPLLTFWALDSNGNKIKVHKSPDFQIKCPDGSYILIEHAGFLKSNEYAIDLSSKMQLYLLSGYILGYSLFITSDDIDGGINTQEINNLLKAIAVRFPEI